MKRRTLASGLLAVGLFSGLATTAVAAPDSSAIPPDRQSYVTDSPVDPYNGDPSSIHVSVNAGQELARSYVHFALDYLPAGAVPLDLVATFHLTNQSGASNTSVYQVYNVNPSSAIVEACALVHPIPASLTASNAPAYDCAHGSAIGKPNAAYDTWVFDLRELVGYWRVHGNTGLVLIPISSGPSDAWAVAYYVSLTTAVAEYEFPATPAAPAAPVTPATLAPVPGASAVTRAPAPVPAPPPASVATSQAAVAPPGTSPAPSLAPPAPAPAAAAPAAPASRGGGTVWWPWVLLGCLLVGAGAIATAHRDQLRFVPARLSAFAAKVGPPSVAAFRAHPRAYSVASVAVVWGLVYSGYSLDQSRPTIGTVAATGSPSTALNGGPAPGPTASASAGPGARSGTATGAVTGVAVTGAAGSSSVGAPTTASSTAAQASEFSGPGHYETIDGVRVFFPSNGGPPVAQMYSGADDTIGITAKQITLCAHAALTYGQAFDIKASDLNVYWDYIHAHGGVYGRTVNASYQNDNYDPGTAVQAAQACKDAGTFMLLGGIGFDQIPAVRVWAEQNHELYLHHIATVEGSAGLHYSFTALPTLEQMGTWFGQLALAKFRGQKVGVIWRDSPNWQPARDIFEQMLRAAGVQVFDYPVQINQGNYTQDLFQLKTAGVTAVFALENALAATEMIQQAEGQKYYPSWLVFPFNLTIKTLGAAALQQPLYGIAAWDPYDSTWSGGPYSSYTSDILEFNREYKAYDPGANLGGDGGDLLFLNWEAQRGIRDLFLECGPNCTRNRMAGILLAGYHRTVPPNCDVDFSQGDHHHGGYLTDADMVVRDPQGNAAWIPIDRCVSSVS